jgi:hypothetical protein
MGGYTSKCEKKSKSLHPTVQVLSPVSAYTICFHFADWQKYFRHKFGASEWRINEGGTLLPFIP